MNLIAIIPARYASTRFPGKPLAEIRGKTMIQRVYEQTSRVLGEVWVATDDTRIEEAVRSFQGHCMLTSSSHKSGTDRINEALDKIEATTGRQFDTIINVQGDEPFIQPGQIEELIGCFQDPEAHIATLIKPVANNQEIFNPNLPKVITGFNQCAIYFSRSPVPYLRNHPPEEWIHHFPFMKHVGMYGYRARALREITRLAPSSLEMAESLEQNRWIEQGYRISTAITRHENHPVDTPEDLERILKSMP
jgi:3-deoxy-manno-octulosonate cytidylyltransferase (CMP-KDO synthetase)